jgi:membrane dipeptidase
MIIDGHCDALTKFYENPNLSFQDDSILDVTLKRLQDAGIHLQCFAIYMTSSIAEPSMEHIMKYIELFHRRILIHPEISFVRTRSELLQSTKDGRIGAMLTLEGADALQGNIERVETLYQLGVRCLGLTWNHANWAADGVLEPRQAPLSQKGRALVERCNKTGMILDVSHLAEPGFWELCERSSRPFIASHCNAYAVCPHPRNLKDDQIRALIQQGGLIGLAFVPFFINQKGPAEAKDLLQHIDHIAGLGGGHTLCLGSDYDGIDEWVSGLEHPGKLPAFKEWLSQYYSDDFVEGLFWRNAYSFYENQLP